MAEEQTPKSFDDAEDPSQPEFPEAQASESDRAAQLAAQARSTRPKRKTPGTRGPSGRQPSVERSAAAQEPVPEEPAAQEHQPGTGGATSVEALQQRGAMPRPVRRTRPTAPAEETPAEPAIAAAAPVRKRENRATVVQRKRTTPAAFAGQSVDELRKVIWPTRHQLTTYFTVVLAFVLFIVAYVGGLDVFFGWLLLKIFGK